MPMIWSAEEIIHSGVDSSDFALINRKVRQPTRFNIGNTRWYHIVQDSK